MTNTELSTGQKAAARRKELEAALTESLTVLGSVKKAEFKRMDSGSKVIIARVDAQKNVQFVLEDVSLAEAVSWARGAVFGCS